MDTNALLDALRRLDADALRNRLAELHRERRLLMTLIRHAPYAPRGVASPVAVAPQTRRANARQTQAHKGTK